MRSFFSFIVLVLSSTALAMPGTLQVTKDSLRILRDDGFKTHFYQGQYSADLTIKNQKLYLTVERKGVTTNATMKIPAGTSIPTNGAFSIAGTTTGQTFDVNGDITTKEDTTSPERSHEACTYYRDEWVCYGYGRERQCYWESVAYQGYQEVEYYFLTRTVTLASLLRSNNGGEGHFNGRTSERKKIYTYRGPCY